MLINTLLSGDLRQSLIVLALTLPAVILCLSVHETAHGLAAYALGDRTAARAGRLTLDPMAHIDPAGFLCMLLLGFGWARPVPVNISNFKNRRAGMAVTAAAGPLSNVILAFIAYVGCFAIRVAGQVNPAFASTFVQVIALFLEYLGALSIGLGVFNLIPVHPLDGSRILNAFLPLRLSMKLQRYEQYLLLGLILLMWFGGTGVLIGTANNLIVHAALGFLGLFF